jgi:putative ABC transport system ATP-binding protein
MKISLNYASLSRIALTHGEGFANSASSSYTGVWKLAPASSTICMMGLQNAGARRGGFEPMHVSDRQRESGPPIGRSPATGDRQITFSITDLTKVYGSGPLAVHALRGVTADLPEGELTVLLGPSGSGKSTFLNILGGLDVASGGKILFDGRDLTTFSDRDLTYYRRQHVGFVFQFYNLIPSLTARENVALITEIADDPMRPEEALELAGLPTRHDHFPAELSGGEQQRVAIARAIAKKPRVLLCDEPTGALDSATGVIVLQAIETVNRELGTTSIVITHNAGIAAMADRVIHFADGAIHSSTENPERKSASEIEW